MAKRQIRVKEALKDVRAGMTDAELMKKHQLAPKGLQSLFSKMVTAGLITVGELDLRMPGYMGKALLTETTSLVDGDETLELKRRARRDRPGQSIKPAEAVRDIKAGLDDAELMNKYRLSASGLQHLFDTLMKQGLISEEELEDRDSLADATVDLKEVIDNDLQDILSELDLETESARGSGGAQQVVAAPDPPDTYHEADNHFASRPEEEPQQVQFAQPQPPAPDAPPQQSGGGPSPDRSPRQGKRTVRLKEVVADIRAGLTDAELMERHQLPHKELQRAFQQLLAEKAITEGELYGRASLYPQTVAISLQDVDDSERHYLAFPVPIYEAGNPSVVGRVREMTETDIGVIGIEAKEKDVKTLIIFPEKFLSVAPFKFQAKCRWVQQEAEGTYSGFEIIKISDEGREKLERLIQTLSFGSL